MSPGEGGLSDLGQGCARCPRDAPAPDRRRPRSAAGACGGALVGRGRDDSVGGRVRGHDGPAAPTNPVSVKAGPAQRAAVPTPPPGRSRRRVARESRSAATRRVAAAAGVSRRTRRARSCFVPANGLTRFAHAVVTASGHAATRSSVAWEAAARLGLVSSFLGGSTGPARQRWDCPAPRPPDWRGRSATYAASLIPWTRAGL